jgi:hypothetical protein
MANVVGREHAKTRVQVKIVENYCVAYHWQTRFLGFRLLIPQIL